MNSAPLHIVFVAPRFAEGQTVGGAETLLKSLAFRLAKHGHRVTFLATCAENHFTWENTLKPGSSHLEGIELIRFPVSPVSHSRTIEGIRADIAHGTQVPEADERAWIEHSVNSEPLYEHIRRHAAEIDVLIAGPYLFGITWYAAQIIPGKTLLLPCLHDEPFARLRIMRQLFQAVGGILYNSEPEAELARQLYHLDPARGRVVGMGLDPFDAQGETFRKKHGIRRPYVFYTGRRETGKGTPLLTRMLATFRERTGRDLLFVCGGSGEIEAPPELHPHLLDIGFVSEQEKHDAMAGADVFIHPSTNESFGIVLLEAFLAHTPALVHAGSAVLRQQCSQANAGLWFRHYPDFEETLGWLLDHPGQRQRMGAAGADYVRRHYAWPVVEQKLNQAIKELIP